MNQDADMKSLLDVAEQTVAAAGCASLITMDEAGLPSSRPVAAFPPDPGFSRIVIGSDTGSRKTVHVRNNPHVVLSYVDMQNRGYLTAIGEAHFSDSIDDRKKYWTDRFSGFFPGGPESDEYTLMVFVPHRLELRSFGLKVAEEPTHWSPVILERGKTGEWRQIN